MLTVIAKSWQDDISFNKINSYQCDEIIEITIKMLWPIVPSLGIFSSLYTQVITQKFQKFNTNT